MVDLELTCSNLPVMTGKNHLTSNHLQRPSGITPSIFTSVYLNRHFSYSAQKDRNNYFTQFKLWITYWKIFSIWRGYVGLKSYIVLKTCTTKHNIGSKSNLTIDVFWLVQKYKYHVSAFIRMVDLELITSKSNVPKECECVTEPTTWFMLLINTW